MSKVASTQNNIATRLAVAVGSAYVSIDEVERKLLSTGLSYKPDEIAEVVVSPADSNELSACVAIAAAAKMPIVARGGMKLGGKSFIHRSTPDNHPAYILYGDYCRMLLLQRWAAGWRPS